MKRTPPPETHFLEREEVNALFAQMPSRGRHAARDRALLLFLYNTGARVQEVADLRVSNLDLGSSSRVHLHGKGDKWRTCPLWHETTRQLRALLGNSVGLTSPETAVFRSATGKPLTRFGIYKLVRKHADQLHPSPRPHRRPISPHVFRHTAAVHLLEAGVEVNVIRGWLGHVSLDTTNRYAEINTPMKEAAVRACTPPPSDSSAAFPRSPAWRNDAALLEWLRSL
jgi:site-specific recombinase XerD